jgi:hypothetical protein
MEFQKERVFTALNADELKPGSKVIVADSLSRLKRYVTTGDRVIDTLSGIDTEDVCCRFLVNGSRYALAYLVSEPEEKDWIVYLCRRDGKKPYLTSCRSDKWEVAQEKYGAKTKLFEGTEEECEKWYTSRKYLTDAIAAWEDGKTIQFEYDGRWLEVSNPEWKINSTYRIKPELKWTDLKVGDVIQNKKHTHSMMVIGIDHREEAKSHIYDGLCWLDDDDLEYWEKVE